MEERDTQTGRQQGHDVVTATSSCRNSEMVQHTHALWRGWMCLYLNDCVLHVFVPAGALCSWCGQYCLLVLSGLHTHVRSHSHKETIVVRVQLRKTGAQRNQVDTSASKAEESHMVGQDGALVT
jgi:hypothetical protein